MTATQSISKGVFKFNAIITSYETIRQDKPFFGAVRWEYLIVDEAHRLKNTNSKVLGDMRQISFDHLTLLTGTPLQNNTQELWTLLNFLDPVSFSSLNHFLDDFGDLKDSSQVAKLQEILKGILLRRMKDDVEKGLAPKEETIIEVELTTLQKKYYRAIYEHNIGFLRKGLQNSNAPSLLNVMMELRKCCNHPYLVKGVEEKNTSPDMPRDEAYNLLIHASGKLVLIDKLLPRLKSEGHKVLIFSQMIRVLDILSEYLDFRGYSHERLDGRIRGNERQQSIDRFCKKDSDKFVFLLCTRAGGLGINLQVADTVIIFDSDWNPQNDVQAMARAHRIGQEKLVKVYRLVTRNTYEKFMFERASKKLGLDQVLIFFSLSFSLYSYSLFFILYSCIIETSLSFSLLYNICSILSQAVLQKMKSEDGENEDSAKGLSSKQLSAKDVDTLLKYGAYGAINDNDEAERSFVEADIEQILQHSSVVVHGASAADTALSSFSKASFVADQSALDLNVDDPNFWQKLMPEVVVKNPNILEEGYFLFLFFLFIFLHFFVFLFSFSFHQFSFFSFF